MKKVFYFTMMVMAVFVMAACSSSPSTPGDALKKYSGYLQSGDYENFGKHSVNHVANFVN